MRARGAWLVRSRPRRFRLALLSRRQAGQGKKVKELFWRMQNRLHKRYVKLKMRGKRENKVIVAIARELSAFLWELQNKIVLPIPTRDA